MPAGVTLASIAAVLVPIGLITVVLRQLPFSFVKWMKDSQFFSLLGMMMPVGVMTILVVYTVHGQAGAPVVSGRLSLAWWSPSCFTCGSGTQRCPSSAEPPSICSSST